MSELTRAEKLAAARQKLINFQNKSNGASKTSKQMTTDSLTQKQDHKIQEKPSDMVVNQVDDIFNINPPITQTSQANEIRTFNASQFFDNIPNNNSTEFLNIDSDSLSSSYVDTNVQEMITENSSPDFNYEQQKQIQASSEVTPDPASGYDESGRSSSASLRQLSLKINGLIGSLTAEGENTHNMETPSSAHIDQNSLTDRFAQVDQRNRELENEIRQQSERYEKRLQNLEALEEQLKLHAQTVGILVAEKTELEAALNKSQDLAKIKSSECEELQSNLRTFQHKIDDLSNQLIAMNSTNISIEEKYQQLEQQSSQSQKIIEETKQQLLETVQLREETSARLTEVLTKCTHLEQQLADKTNDLNLTQIRLQQLGLEYESASGETKAVDGRQLEAALEQTEATLNETKKSHDQQTRQYQAYMKQLNTQLQQVSEQNISLKNERDSLAFREQERIEHVSQLERRLQELQGKLNQAQQQFEQQQHKNNSATDKHEALEKENHLLKEQISHLEETLSSRESKLKDLEDQMTILLQEQEETDSASSTQAEQAQLLAAIESDKVAAARAISQNQMLKSQLDVMTECFNNINESKLELMDTLHRERREARRLRETVEDYEKELNRLRDRLLDSETKLAEASGIPLDQWRERWRRQSQDHHDQHHHHHHNHDHHHHEETSKENLKTDDITEFIHEDNINEENKDELKENDENTSNQEVAEKTTQTTHKPLTSSPQVPSSSIDPNSSNLRQAMEQLQMQFTRKMSQIAELNDEKQRLEHIVMQLQSETETIGEYVTLYQTQRCALRERAREKDEAMRKLARDKEEMRCKLTRLEALVGRLVGPTHEQHQHQETLNGSSNGLPAETETPTPTTSEVLDQPKDISTAGQILALLKEIGSSNLVEGQQTSCMEPFHPCPLCSGRLLTV